jgi:hypothetical protein
VRPQNAAAWSRVSNLGGSDIGRTFVVITFIRQAALPALSHQMTDVLTQITMPLNYRSVTLK